MGILLHLLGRAAFALLVLTVTVAPHAQAASPMDERLALHLLNRLGFGPAPGEVERVRAMGVHAYVDSQLAPPPLPPRLRQLADAGMPAGEARLLRAIASPRQLEEVLVAFWLAHAGAGQHGETIEALRPLVFGRYAALHAALAQGSALDAAGERAARDALLRHFVATPSAGLQRRLAQVWDATGGDQRAVLRALLTSPEFLAPAQWQGKRKDGWRFVVSAVRLSGVAVENAAPLVEFVDAPMTEGERAAFVRQLVEGRLPLAMAPVRPSRSASSAPPLRATVTAEASVGAVAQPGPILMAAPTPSAAAMALAARSRPADSVRLAALLRSEDFLRY